MHRACWFECTSLGESTLQALLLGKVLQLPEGELRGNPRPILDPSHSRQSLETWLLSLQTTTPGVDS